MLIFRLRHTRTFTALSIAASAILSVLLAGCAGSNPQQLANRSNELEKRTTSYDPDYTDFCMFGMNHFQRRNSLLAGPSDSVGGDKSAQWSTPSYSPPSPIYASPVVSAEGGCNFHGLNGNVNYWEPWLTYGFSDVYPEIGGSTTLLHIFPNGSQASLALGSVGGTITSKIVYRGWGDLFDFTDDLDASMGGTSDFPVGSPCVIESGGHCYSFVGTNTSAYDGCRAYCVTDATDQGWWVGNSALALKGLNNSTLECKSTPVLVSFDVQQGLPTSPPNSAAYVLSGDTDEHYIVVFYINRQNQPANDPDQIRIFSEAIEYTLPFAASPTVVGGGDFGIGSIAGLALPTTESILLFACTNSAPWEPASELTKPTGVSSLASCLAVDKYTSGGQSYERLYIAANLDGGGARVYRYSTYTDSWDWHTATITGQTFTGSSPIIDGNGCMYIASSDRLYCYDTAASSNSSYIWRSTDIGNSIKSTPALANGFRDLNEDQDVRDEGESGWETVYVGSDNGNMYAFQN